MHRIPPPVLELLPLFCSHKPRPVVGIVLQEIAKCLVIEQLAVWFNLISRYFWINGPLLQWVVADLYRPCQADSSCSSKTLGGFKLSKCAFHRLSTQLFISRRKNVLFHLLEVPQSHFLRHGWSTGSSLCDFWRLKVTIFVNQRSCQAEFLFFSSNAKLSAPWINEACKPREGHCSQKQGWQ